ncbi:hypothetical protein [Microbispora sp. NPDC049125]|uniref:hypothetical protein n=1 Tax=Microbispora sp. NPDC049125 TaxID=3154929 RepID=UPI0034652F2F
MHARSSINSLTAVFLIALCLLAASALVLVAASGHGAHWTISANEHWHTQTGHL